VELKVVAAQLTYIERLYLYHYAPGAVVLWVSLEWEPPESPLGFLFGEGRPVRLEDLFKRAKRYGAGVLVFDGPLPFEAAEEALANGFAVAVRHDSPLKLPEGASVLLHGSERSAVEEQLRLYDSVHLEVYVPEPSLLPEGAPEDLPIHTFSWKVYARLKDKFHYVYNHVQPLREDTKCPKCGTPNAVREMGTLIGWDGPRCRRCGFKLHYHTFDLPEAPSSVREWLSWRPSVPVL